MSAPAPVAAAIAIGAASLRLQALTLEAVYGRKSMTEAEYVRRHRAILDDVRATERGK